MEYNWYIVHTLSGSEKKVKESILEQAKKEDLEQSFNDIVVPMLEVPELKKGKKVLTEKKIMPGYILVNMSMTDKAWHIVKNIPRVTGFLGGSKKPHPVPQKEVDEIFAQLETEAKDASNSLSFEVGERVKVIDGPFESFVGDIEEVDPEKSRLKVSVSIFGRSTPVDLNYNQVEKTKE